MRVPTYDNLQTTPSVTPNVGVQGYTGPNPEQIGGQQMQDLGASAQRAGDATTRIALSMQDMANQVRVNDAVNQARKAAQDLAYNPDTGYLNLKGDAALTRPNGQDLPTEYGDKLRESLSQIAGTLGNDEQRRQFQLNATDLQAQFHGQVESHMLGEFRSHALSVQDGTINLASDDAKRNWNNPDLIGPSLKAAKAAVMEKGRMSGWSASQTDAALLSTTSKVHSDVVMAALENGNPNYALTYLNARKGEMTADDILKVQGHVNQQVWLGQAQGAVQAATSAVITKLAPTPFDRMQAITAQTESGNQDFKPDGTPLEGPYIPGQGTAKGRMQVMDGTAANPGHGITPADLSGTPQQQAAERARVGTQLLQALMQKYGDPAKAWAAYNWGEGNLDKALKEWESNRAGTAVDWLTYTPKETQKYVTTNMKQLEGSGGQAPRPTELDFVNDTLSRLPPGSPPQVIKLAREQATSQFAIINKSMSEIGDSAVSAAQRWLAQNGGNYAAMPPAIRDAVDRYAPGKSDDLIKYARVFERGENVSDLVLYNRLAAHPEEMTAMSDAQFEGLRAHLSQADFKHFSNERANYQNGKTDESAGAINNAAFRASLNPRLEALGINVAPSPKDTAAMERVGGIRQFVRNSLFDAQQQAGKKFTPQEVEEHIDRLFAQSVEFRKTFLGFDRGTDSQNLMSMQIGDLPSGAAEGLRTALISHGNKNPTDNDVLNLYRTMHAKR
jgi:soluble lytic murein transglycosylase